MVFGVIFLYCVWYLNDSNRKRNQREQQERLQATADLFASVGQYSKAAAISEPERIFETDHRIVLPPAPEDVISARYGLILDNALAIGGPDDILGPDNLEQFTENAQILAGVVPVDTRYFALHQASLAYPQARISAAQAQRRREAVLFHTKALRQVAILERTEEELKTRSREALSQLQACLRRLYYSDPYGYG